LQEAYEVLSDAQERAWYDGHREQILQGVETDGPGTDSSKVNLWKYFSSSCYNGFHDGENGFFGVYNELFLLIEAEEMEWRDSERQAPCFGGQNSPTASVIAFYQNWTNFVTAKPFLHSNKWNLADASNRSERRAMEVENQKLRKLAKKEYNDRVRTLVDWVRKRDPRELNRQLEKAAELRKQAQEKAARKLKQEEDAILQRETIRELERLRWESLDLERKQAMDESESNRQFSENDEKTKSEPSVCFVCEICKKHFKSENQFKCHEKSKKHIETLAAFRKVIERQFLESERPRQLCRTIGLPPKRTSSSPADRRRKGLWGLTWSEGLAG